MHSTKYTMQIGLNVLNHLGINLYSNTPSVIAEVIANAWDAGATRVDINFSKKKKFVTVSDNGCGMSEEELNSQYLYIGYQRRKHQPSPKDRKPMGRKGIGKLSLFSIANKIHVQSRKDGKENALLMDAQKIKKAIEQDNPEKISPYHPQSVPFDDALLTHQQGTAIKIMGLKKRITQMTEKSLRKRLSRRFSVIGESEQFEVYLNGKKIDYLDRDYFDKARFIFEYGEVNFSTYCKKLDRDEKGKPFVDKKCGRFNQSGISIDTGKYQIKGWIGIAHHSNDLDNKKDGDDENLNNIVIVVRGKVAQEDILHQFRKGGLITKYMYGEIQADFLDEDDEDDIATSSRQKIVEDEPRYHALKTFIGKELDYIWAKTNKLKAKKGVEKALDYHPAIKEWYDSLNKKLKKKADSLFGTIDQIEADESHKATLYVSGILAFEKMKLDDSLSQLDDIDPDHLNTLLGIFKEIDDIEAVYYYEIINERLQTIARLEKITKDDEKEQVIQKYVFDHLWLLDPAWERAASEAKMEERIQAVISANTGKDNETVKNMRVDIQYKKVSGAHVIIELKRSSRAMKKTELEEQIKQYMNTVRNELAKIGKLSEVIEGICIVGKLPQGWDGDPLIKQKEIESLRSLSIRILTYDELIHNAYSAYSKFIEKQGKIGYLRKLIKAIREMSETEKAN